MKCARCKIHLTEEESEELLFESKYKRTNLILCLKCFISCRNTFTERMENK